MQDSGSFFWFPDALMNHTLLADNFDLQPLLSNLIYELTLTCDDGLAFSARVEKQRNGMLWAGDLAALAEAPRFETAEEIADNRDVYIALVRDTCLGFTTDEALQKLQGHDVHCAKCLSLDEVLSQE